MAFDPAINKNRELAIINKIIAYAQAGLYIVYISTPGQNEFLNTSTLKYIIIEYDEISIKKCMIRLISLKRTNHFNKELQFLNGANILGNTLVIL